VSADEFATVGTDVVGNLVSVARRRSEAGLTFDALRPATAAAGELFARAVVKFETFPARRVEDDAASSPALDLSNQRLSVVAAAYASDSAGVEAYEMSSWILTQVELIGHATREIGRALAAAGKTPRS
jgi:hypothetical protein